MVRSPEKFQAADNKENNELLLPTPTKQAFGVIVSKRLETRDIRMTTNCWRAQSPIRLNRPISTLAPQDDMIQWMPMLPTEPKIPQFFFPKGKPADLEAHKNQQKDLLVFGIIVSLGKKKKSKD